MCYRFVVLAIDRRTGRTIWERTATEAKPHEASHQENGTYASSSAITDGQRVYAWFESQGMYVYDMDGTLLWSKDLGDKTMRNQFGEGSTPVLAGDRLVIVWDHLAGSFIVALDATNGRELWRQSRDEIDTWATPLVVEQGGRKQAIVPGKNKIRSYDLETGAIVWESKGTTMNPIPSPVFGDGMVFVTSGFQGNNLKAIRLANAKGDITGTESIVWTLDRDTPYVPSPLLYDNVLYLLKTNSGILSAFDAPTGKPHYQLQRLDGLPEVFSSPVGASGRVYIAARDGVTHVIRHGSTYELLAKNKLDDGFDASPALVDNAIYLRGYQNLYDRIPTDSPRLATVHDGSTKHRVTEKRTRPRLRRRCWSPLARAVTWTFASVSVPCGQRVAASVIGQIPASRARPSGRRDRESKAVPPRSHRTRLSMGIPSFASRASHAARSMASTANARWTGPLPSWPGTRPPGVSSAPELPR